MMKKLILMAVIVMMAVGCGRGPKHVKDIKDAQVSAMSFNSQERYQLVTDPATKLSGVAEKDGSILIPVKYTNIVPCYNTDKNKDVFLVCNPEGLCGAYDTGGKKIIKDKFADISLISISGKTDSLFVFQVGNNKKRNIDYEVGSEGNKKKIHDDGSDHLIGIMSVEGKELVPCEFRSVDYAGNGFFEVVTVLDKELESYSGLYKDGKEVIPCKYSSLKVSGYANGALASISQENGKEWYAFDLTDGCAKTKLLYDGMSVRVSDHFIIYPDRNPQTMSFKDQVLNFKGGVVIAPNEFNKIDEKDGFFICDAGGYDILMNSAYQTVFEDKYYRLQPENGLFITFDRNRRKKGMITKEGKWIVPCNYSDIEVKDNKIMAYSGRNTVTEFPLP